MGRLTKHGIAISTRRGLASPWRAEGEGSCGHLPLGRGQAARTIYTHTCLAAAFAPAWGPLHAVARDRFCAMDDLAAHVRLASRPHGGPALSVAVDALGAAGDGTSGDRTSGDGTSGDGAAYIRVASARELRAMCAVIRRPARDYPVVGLSCRPGEGEPALPVQRVREIIGPGVPIYVIEAQQARVTRVLLPPRHGVFGGAARVWWPGVGEHSDPLDHPLVFNHTGVYGERALEQLADELKVRSVQPVELTEGQRLLLQERLRVRAEKRNRELAEQLHVLQHECNELERRALHAERSLGVSGREAGSRGKTVDDTGARCVALTERRSTPADLGERLHLLIVRQWAQTLKDPHDWAERPLVSYSFSDRFMNALTRQANPPLARIAWVCAMVACGLAPKLEGIAPRPLLAGRGAKQVVREDGAKGWRCNLKHSSHGGLRLHYWVHPSGRIEFDAFGSIGELGRP